MKFQSARLLAAILPLGVATSAFAVTVDGRMDGAEWRAAELVTEFRKTQPLTGEAPSNATEAWILATPDGLAVASARPSRPRCRARASACSATSTNRWTAST